MINRNSNIIKMFFISENVAQPDTDQETGQKDKEKAC